MNRSPRHWKSTAKKFEGHWSVLATRNTHNHVTSPLPAGIYQNLRKCNIGCAIHLWLPGNMCTYISRIILQKTLIKISTYPRKCPENRDNSYLPFLLTSHYKASRSQTLVNRKKLQIFLCLRKCNENTLSTDIVPSIRIIFYIAN